MDIRTPSRKVVLVSVLLFLFFGVFVVANFIHELQILFAFMSGETVPAYSDMCRTPGVNCAELPVLRDYIYDVVRAFLSMVPFLVALVAGFKILRKQAFYRFWVPLWTVTFLFYPLLVIYYLLHGDIWYTGWSLLYICGIVLASLLAGTIVASHIRKAKAVPF